MIKKLQKIMLMLAVTTVIGHSIFPHIHPNEKNIAAHEHQHDGSANAKHHHDDEEKDSNKQQEVLSFAPLDDNFIPGKSFSKKFEQSATHLQLLVTLIFTPDLSINTKTDYGSFKDYPPPDAHLSDLPSRAPPVLI